MGTGTTVYKSCSAQLNGEYYIFGGTGENKRQVSYKFTFPTRKVTVKQTQTFDSFLQEYLLKSKPI